MKSMIIVLNLIIMKYVGYLGIMIFRRKGLLTRQVFPTYLMMLRTNYLNKEHLSMMLSITTNSLISMSLRRRIVPFQVYENVLIIFYTITGLKRYVKYNT